MAYTITLVGCKGDEIELIAMVMEICGLEMGEASKIVDHMPNILFENINEESANKYKKLLEGAGAILKIDEAAAPSSPDPFAFPEPDFGKMMAGGVAKSGSTPTPNTNPNSRPTSVPLSAFAPTPAPAPAPVVPEVEEPAVEPVVEPEPVATRQSVVEITPRTSEYAKEVTEEPAVEESAAAPAEEETSADSSEETKYDYTGYCPKCGSAFVSVKKVGGLFGSSKVKCVCEACKYKF